MPINNYAWSKLGGEAAVQMYKNSLILRVCMTEKPFVHGKNFIDFKTNFTFHENIANFLFKALNLKGLYNIGGKTQSAYEFAKQFNKKTIPISIKSSGIMKKFANISMNLDKIKKHSFAKLLDDYPSSYPFSWFFIYPGTLRFCIGRIMGERSSKLAKTRFSLGIV